MGYRHSFMLTRKEKVEELRNKTMEDFKKEFHNQNEFDDFDEYLIEKLSPLKYGEECIAELGKLYWCEITNVEERLLEKSSKIKFADKEVEHYLTDENCLAICSKETLEEYIKICRELMLDYYEKMSTWSKEKVEEQFRLERHKYKLCPEMIDYEYSSVAIKLKTILDYNVIDFDKYELLLVAW